MIALSNTLNFNLINNVLWLIAILLKISIGVAVTGILVTLIIFGISVLDGIE